VDLKKSLCDIRFECCRRLAPQIRINLTASTTTAKKALQCDHGQVADRDRRHSSRKSVEFV
jgi:hypothetical protein